VAEAAGRPQNKARAKADAISLAEEAEAEAAEAEALAAAARARARAIKLRREGEPRAKEGADDATVVADSEEGAAETTESAEPSEEPESAAKPTESSESRNPFPAVVLAIGALVIVTTLGLLGTSGWLLWHHHTVQAEHERSAQAEKQRSAAYIAAARQGVINLTSLDFNNAKESVQRVLDSSTGAYRDDFQRVADDFESVVKDSKVVTQGTVVAAAVEKMDKDSAVVLLLGNERVTNLAGAKDNLRIFRFRVSVVKDGDRIKISNVEYVI
jgi:Mce-associated membrane protein